ncbi:hypothetical protein FRB97_007837 [Tulasnella sp. 331]|nr:hypothetical protein FRB97_007837 [Tulasnella sp. 331]KAG8880379.1 hypothetical protein FRB98_005158 [Tulasnella sp. 332]
MVDIPLDAAHFMGLIFSMGLYGIFLTMFSSSIRPLWNRRHRGTFVLIITICLFITTTGNVAIFIAVNYNAFVRYRQNPGVEAYLQAEWTLIVPLESAVLPSVFMAIAIFVCDLLLLWRLHLVWSKHRWVVIVPATFLFIESVLSTVLCVMAALHTGSLDTTIACGIATDLVNFICTPLIAGRLWWVGRRGERQDTRSLYMTLVTRFIESGSLYTMTQIVYMGFTFTPGYPGVSTFLTYIFTMVIAIAPMLLVLHLNMTTVSEMHPVAFQVTTRQGGGEGVIPPRSMGLISTTIAFNPVPFGSSQSYMPSHGTADPEKADGETA